MGSEDLGLSLEQIARLLEDDVSLCALRSMLRLKRIEIKEEPNQEQQRLSRVEMRLREIEETRLRSRREGRGATRPCFHCGRIVRELEGRFCPYSGKLLTPRHAGLLPIDRPTKGLSMRSLGFLLAALALIAVVAGLATVIADGRDAPELVARAPPESPSADPRLALLSVTQERLKEHGKLRFEGQIQNVSGASLPGIEVVVSLYDADPALISARGTPIDHAVLSPGEISSFSLDIDASPWARSYGVIFQQPSGSTISVRDDRSK